MRNFGKLLLTATTVGLLSLSAACGGGVCEKAMDNQAKLIKAEGSELEKKMFGELTGDKRAAFIKMCDLALESKPEETKKLECIAAAGSYKDMKACESAPAATK